MCDMHTHTHSHSIPPALFITDTLLPVFILSVVYPQTTRVTHAPCCAPQNTHITRAPRSTQSYHGVPQNNTTHALLCTQSFHCIPQNKTHIYYSCPINHATVYLKTKHTYIIHAPLRAQSFHCIPQNKTHIIYTPLTTPLFTSKQHTHYSCPTKSSIIPLYTLRQNTHYLCPINHIY